jgi:hypothetical protein
MRPAVFQVGGVLYWVIQTRNPDTMVLKDADSTPSVAVRKNGASVADSVTVTKRSATTGIYDCSYNPASEVEGDSFTLEESATVTGTTTSSATYTQTWNVRAIRTGAVALDSATALQLDDIETAVADVQTDVDAANNYLSALSTVLSGITSLANWLRRGFRKDTGSAGMITAQSEINTGGTATFSGITDSLEAIRDNQAATAGASLEDIIAGVQSVSGGIIAAQDSSSFYITSGDTWTQDVDDLGNIVGKTLVFTIKRNARDADTAALVLINSTDGLTRLAGAAASASAWGSLAVLDDTLGNIRLTLESDATLLLKSGTYADGIKSLEDGDDRTLRQRGKTIISAGVIDDIS